MENADKPAYPVEVDVEGVPKDSGTYERLMDKARELGNGLTKRERFAMAVLQGFLSAGQIDTPNYQGAMRYKGLAKESIRYADELLRQLEETK